MNRTRLRKVLGLILGVLSVGTICYQIDNFWIYLSTMMGYSIGLLMFFWKDF